MLRGNVLIEEYQNPNASDRMISLSDFQNIEYDNNYVVKVRVSSATLSGEYGEGCPIAIQENIPNVPSRLIAEGISSMEIELHWQDNSDIESGYLVERKEPAGTFMQLAQLPSNTAYYLDAPLASNSNFIYRVTALGSNGNSLPSNEAATATDESVILYPNGGEVYFANQDFPVGWLGRPRRLTRELDLVAVNIADNSEWEVGRADDIGSFTGSIPSGISGQFRLEIRSLSGEVLDRSDAPFSILPPTIASVAGFGSFNASFLKQPNEYVHETEGDSLKFHFDERYLDGGIMAACIYDWERRKVTDLPLGTNLGGNAYVLNIGNRGMGLPLDSCYSLEIMYNDGHTGFLKFRRTQVPELEAEIRMEVNAYDCDAPDANEITFRCEASGGSEPYEVVWYLSPTLYEEDARRIETDRYSNDASIYLGSPQISDRSEFSVFDQPGYYIIMIVRDACGQEVRKIARVQCSTPETPDDQIFIEIINVRPTDF